MEYWSQVGSQSISIAWWLVRVTISVTVSSLRLQMLENTAHCPFCCLQRLWQLLPSIMQVFSDHPVLGKKNSFRKIFQKIPKFPKCRDYKSLHFEMMNSFLMQRMQVIGHRNSYFLLFIPRIWELMALPKWVLCVSFCLYNKVDYWPNVHIFSQNNIHFNIILFLDFFNEEGARTL